MQCSGCGTENPTAARFCEECGAALGRVCPSCGHEVGPKARFCAGCGRPLGAAPTARSAAGAASLRGYTPEHLGVQLTGSRAAVEGERKHVTVLFCDIADSTALAERLGPEAFHLLLNRFFEQALAAVHRYEGTVNQFLGDGLMALFGAPITHEDHARRAVLAALAIQRGVAEHLAEPGSAGGGGARPTAAHAAGQDAEVGPVRVRIGLNTGTVVVGAIGDDLRRDYTAMGEATNTAARLQQLAEPGSILIGEGTARLVEGYARVEALGPTRLRGRRDPINVYRVVGPGPRRSPLEGLPARRLSRLVGRQRQLADLRSLLAQVEAGRGQAVGVAAEPGMGKSRLVYEFRRFLAGRRVTYLEGRCLSYGGGTPYLPILDIVRGNCGIGEADGPAVVVDKARLALAEVGLDSEAHAAYLLHLLGLEEGTGPLRALTPEAIKVRTFETLRLLALSGSRKRPLILVIEDLHWIDKTSEEYLASLVASMAGAPIMVLGTYRPRYVPPWMDQSYSTQLALQRLAPEDSLAIARSVLRLEEVPEPVAQVILSKAEGNPFFVEELSKVVAEHGDPGAELAVPDTVQGVLMARIDGLPEEPRRCLQTASVLGREFPLRLLAAIWNGPDAPEAHLAELTRLEFIYEQGGPEEPVYAFKHALTQDVAYDSLLSSRRRALHAAAGRALERFHAERLDDVCDRLAYHYAKTDEAAKAVEYLSRFAEKAARSHVHADAVTAIEQALVHAERLAEPERSRRTLELVLRLAPTFYVLARIPQTLDLLLAQRDRLERIGDPRLAGPYHVWLGHTYSHLSDLERSVEHARRALEEARRCDDPSTLGKGHYVLARTWGFLLCHFEEGIAHAERAIEEHERTREWFWLGQSYWALAMNCVLMGEFERGLEAAAKGFALGEQSGDVRAQTINAWVRGWLLATRGDWEPAIAACELSAALSRDVMGTIAANGWLGRAYLEKGDPERAIPLLEQGYRDLTRIGYRGALGWFTAWLGQAHLLGGDGEQAREIAAGGIEIARSVPNPWAVADNTRVLGQAAVLSGDLGAARDLLEGALQTFTSLDARLEAGKTHLVLADLAERLGQERAVLAHISAARRLFEAVRAPAYLERTTSAASLPGAKQGRLRVGRRSVLPSLCLTPQSMADGALVRVMWDDLRPRAS